MIAVLKVGDIPGVSTYKEGMLVCALPDDAVISSHMRNIYALVRMEDNVLEDLILEDVENDSDDPDNYTTRSRLIPLNYVADLIGDSNLVSEWRGLNRPVPIHDAMSLRVKDFRRIKDLRASDPSNILGDDPVNIMRHFDRQVVASGEFTIGSGGDYSNFNAAVGDVAATLTGNLTFTIISDFADTSEFTLATDLNGKRLRFTSGTPHDGDPTKGFQWNENVGGSGGKCWRLSGSSDSVGSGVLELDNFRIGRTASNQSDPSRGPFFLTSPSGPFKMELHDILMNWGGLRGRGMRLGDSDILMHMWNVVMANFRPNASDSGGEGFALFSADLDSKFDNLVAHGCRTPFNVGNRAFTMRSCYGFDATIFSGAASDVFNAHEFATGLGNASDDGTAANFSSNTGNLINVVPEDQFVSIDPTSANYLTLKSTSDLIHAGSNSTNTSNTEGIRGNTRPNECDLTTIGVVEAAIGVECPSIFPAPSGNIDVKTIKKRLTWELTATLTFTDGSVETISAVRDTNASKENAFRFIGSEDILTFLGRDSGILSLFNSFGIDASGVVSQQSDTVNGVIWRFAATFTNSIVVAGSNSTISPEVSSDDIALISDALVTDDEFVDFASQLFGV